MEPNPPHPFFNTLSIIFFKKKMYAHCNLQRNRTQPIPGRKPIPGSRPPPPQESGGGEKISFGDFLKHSQGTTSSTPPTEQALLVEEKIEDKKSTTHLQRDSEEDSESNSEDAAEGERPQKSEHKEEEGEGEEGKSTRSVEVSVLIYLHPI